MVNKYWDITSDGEIRPSENFSADAFKNGLIIPEEVNGIKVTKIAYGAFSNWETLTGSLTLPDGLTEIDDWAFYNCKGLTGSLTMPDSVTKIGISAFEDCDGFDGSLTISNNVTSIGEAAFANCPNILTCYWRWEEYTSIQNFLESFFAITKEEDYAI